MLWPNLIKKFKNPSFAVNKKNEGYIKRIHSQKEFVRVIERERERANRNKHHFSLIILELGLKDLKKDKTNIFISKIGKRIRIIDEIGWYGQNRVGVILPYTSSNGAREFIESLGDLMDSLIPAPIFTICTYPPGCNLDNQTQPIFVGGNRIAIKPISLRK